MSTVTAVIIFGFYIWLVNLYWPFPSAGLAWAAGSMWLVLTVLFEFLFGRFVMKHPWKRLLEDYDLGKGRVWALFLIWLAAAPYVFYLL